MVPRAGLSLLSFLALTTTTVAPSFGTPHLVVDKGWADGFVGIGAASPTRLVLGDKLLSTSAGASWTPTTCGGRGGFLSRCPGPGKSLCDQMIVFGDFEPRLKQGQTGTNFTMGKPITLESDQSGKKVSCQPSEGGPIRFVGLPPIVTAKFSVGGLRFGGASSVFLGDGGKHRYLASVIVTLASNGAAASGATSVLAMASADGKLWEYLAPIALASDFPASQEGPNEMDLAWLPGDTTIIAVLRLDGGDGPKTHPYVDYHRSVSTDRGSSWTKAAPIGAGCARPRLLQLGGTMLLSGGRMRNMNTSDVILWSSTDNGETWAVHSISAAHNVGMVDPALRYDAKVNSTTYGPRETNSYTSLVALNSTSAVVTYDMILTKKTNTSKLSTHCVGWPIADNETKAGCEEGGDALHDGGTYHYNTGRGTARSVCARLPGADKNCKAGCECCRTASDKTALEPHTFAMAVTFVSNE
jgi:hypothetical protein